MGIFDQLFGPPTQERFGESFIAEMRRQGFQDPVIFAAAKFHLLVRGGARFIALQNFYAEYCLLDPSQRSANLTRMATIAMTSLRGLPDKFEDALSSLQIRLMSRLYFSKIYLEWSTKEQPNPLDVATERIGEHLCATVVHDHPFNMVSVGNEQLAKWGVTLHEALEVGRKNLARETFTYASIGERVYESRTRDNYDASRLLITDLIRDLKVQGDHIAMVPNRDTLLIAGSEDEAGLAILLTLAEKARETAHPMVFTPLRQNGNTWEDWMPPSDHPLYWPFKMLEIDYLTYVYETQQKLLDAVNTKCGENVFVASYMAYRYPDGKVSSDSVWTKGLDTLLPKTTKLAFGVEGEGIVAAGEWERVVELVGDLMEETDLYPVRYRVRRFPSDAQLEAIRNL